MYYIILSMLYYKTYHLVMANAIVQSRISLRPFKDDDIDDVLLWLGDDRVVENTRLEMLSNGTYNENLNTQMIERMRGRDKTCNSREEALNFIKNKWIYPSYQSICLDDHSIGIFWILSYNDWKHSANLGYAIGFKYWGQGIVTKGLKILLSKVFQEFHGLVRLQALTLVEGKASQRVLEKVGFHREGLLRKYVNHKGCIEDLYIFSFLSTDEISSGVV
ncbi:uncharacterized protein LOC131626877 [Vicia villosa]|uniref:uncharacterized protein LOC131626877 n=1 Tax=Vicia villosa TaxID=3911 RepID=UPI00273AFBF2|nr:uncharacterized protein LOC131626877 [Vicia villosa]